MSDECGCGNNVGFSKVDEIGDSQLINQLEENMKAFLDYGFLNIGGFINVGIVTSGHFGGSFDQLYVSSNPAGSEGTVYETWKKDLVHQTDISYKGINPTAVSGIYVDDTFIPGPTGDQQYGYSINYPLGQVVFNKPVPEASKVQMAYSYHWVQVYKSSASPYWKELQELSYKPGGADNGHNVTPPPATDCAPIPVYNDNCKYVNPILQNPNHGTQNQPPYNNSIGHGLQMPCIVVEPIARSSAKPYQLGCVDHWIDQDILLHVFAENGIDKNRICDIIRLQKEKTICLYDQNKVVNSGVNPLNWDGSVNQNGLNYPDLVTNNDYLFAKCFFKDIKLMDMESRNKNLYWCTIRVTTEVIL